MVPLRFAYLQKTLYQLILHTKNRVLKKSGLKVSFYLKKSEMSEDGLCPVMGRINVGRHSEAAFSAKLSASPKAWMLGRATAQEPPHEA